MFRENGLVPSSPHAALRRQSELFRPPLQGGTGMGGGRPRAAAAGRPCPGLTQVVPLAQGSKTAWGLKGGALGEGWGGQSVGKVWGGALVKVGACAGAVGRLEKVWESVWQGGWIGGTRICARATEL